MECKVLHMNPRQVLRPVLDDSQTPHESFNEQEREALKLKKDLPHTPLRKQRLKELKRQLSYGGKDEGRQARQIHSKHDFKSYRKEDRFHF